PLRARHGFPAARCPLTKARNRSKSTARRDGQARPSAGESAPTAWAWLRPAETATRRALDACSFCNRHTVDAQSKVEAIRRRIDLQVASVADRHRGPPSKESLLLDV